jgi:hypothetical protein
MQSTLVKNQVKTFGPVRFEGWRQRAGKLEAIVRYDDQCNNGHNTLSITGSVYSSNGRNIGGGCCHDEIAKSFPQLKKYIKFHLVSSNGPLHYIANSLYWAKEGNLEYFRRTALWDKATIEDMNDPNLESILSARLPGIMAEFQLAIEELGFTY